jgi:hypothetical protein
MNTGDDTVSTRVTVSRVCHCSLQSSTVLLSVRDMLVAPRSFRSRVIEERRNSYNKKPLSVPYTETLLLSCALDRSSVGLVAPVGEDFASDEVACSSLQALHIDTQGVKALSGFKTPRLEISYEGESMVWKVYHLLAHLPACIHHRNYTYRYDNMLTPVWLCCKCVCCANTGSQVQAGTIGQSCSSVTCRCPQATAQQQHCMHWSKKEEQQSREWRESLKLITRKCCSL